MRYSIGKLSSETGVNIETIRYYEKVGLMPEPFRSDGGHRIYDEQHQARLLFVRRCRDLGFPLEDIRDLLALADEGEPCASMQPALDAQLALVRAKIDALRAMEEALETILKSSSGCDAPECSVSNALYGCAKCSCACSGTCDLQ